MEIGSKGFVKHVIFCCFWTENCFKISFWHSKMKKTNNEELIKTLKSSSDQNITIF